MIPKNMLLKNTVELTFLIVSGCSQRFGRKKRFAMSANNCLKKRSILPWAAGSAWSQRCCRPFGVVTPHSAVERVSKSSRTKCQPQTLDCNDWKVFKMEKEMMTVMPGTPEMQNLSARATRNLWSCVLLVHALHAFKWHLHYGSWVGACVSVSELTCVSLPVLKVELNKKYLGNYDLFFININSSFFQLFQ